jgi:eukaryotic-like serine/threonine-protein kinase
VTPERWQRIKQLFGDASALAPEARAALLDQACAGDAELRSEVDSLLGHSREGAIVDLPAAAYVTGAAFSHGAEQWIGQRLGPYELTALLGHGGMGEVYRARRVDAEYDKEVAIKLVPAGYQAGFVLQRLRTERQILATLEHPHIARLIDGGASPQGVPYLVMELVDGQPIDRYCAGLPLDRKLDLFREVCDAVSYAHQRLVVHRDLKPSNILVTTDGRVKLLDFGIAKLLRPSAGDHTLPPATLMQTFTPGFASPEQVLGLPITTASDLYSLGVLLYLLLTGRSPYRGTLDSTQDAIREICETEPEPPRVTADLDAICLRALRKEPAKRYASVEAFSEDVRRYLRGLPVVARGDQFSYRAGKFLRRHLLETAAAAAVSITLVGGLVFSLREARIAEAQRARAEKHFQSVRELADTFMFKVHDAIAPLPGSVEARAVLIETSAKYLNTLAAESGEDALLQMDLANAYLKLGNVQGQAYAANAGKQTEAVESYRKAAELAGRLVVAHPRDLPALRTLRDSLAAHSYVVLQLGKTQEALTTSTRALAICEQLAALDPGPWTERERALSHVSHAVVLDYSGQESEAGRHLGQAFAILEDLRDKNPTDLTIATALARAYTMRAITSLGPTRDDVALEAAVNLYRKALALDQLVLDASPAGERDVPKLRSVVVGHANLVNLSNHVGSPDEALMHCRQAQALIERLRVDKANVQTDLDGAMLDGHCARTSLRLGKLDDAERAARANLANLERLARESDNLYVQFHSGLNHELLGSLAERRGDCGRAVESYRTAMVHFAKVTAAVVLDNTDLEIVDAATAGLDRCGRRRG